MNIVFNCSQKMSSHEVNDRKQKLNNIILKITEFQLLKLKAASNGGCNREINLCQILEQDNGESHFFFFTYFENQR